MDMTGGYAKSVCRPRFRARLVIDKCRVGRLATKALEEICRQDWNKLRESGQSAAVKLFKHDR